MFSDDPQLVPLDRFVFNTEAHPLPVIGPMKWTPSRGGTAPPSPPPPPSPPTAANRAATRAAAAAAASSSTSAAAASAPLQDVHRRSTSRLRKRLAELRAAALALSVDNS